MKTTLILVSCIAIIIIFWNFDLKARELALLLIKKTCKKSSLKLLDDTLYLSKRKFSKDINNKICFQRIYKFEYMYFDGDNKRETGFIVLKGLNIVEINTNIYEDIKSDDDNNIYDFHSFKNKK